MNRLLFIFNAHSGRALIKNKLPDIIDMMVKADYEVTVYPTQAKDDARRVAEEKAGNYELLVCSGGDGTLDEVVSGLMKSQKKVPLGYIPAGSTNDFANSLKIPKDMIKAAQIAIEGRRFPCDVGKFNEKYFIYVAAFGIFTEASYSTRQEWKNILGHAAYILEGAKSLYGIASYHMRVEHDGEVIEGEFIFGMITNSVSVGGFKNMTGKNVELDDGLFEVTLIRMPQNPLELNAILASLTNLIDDTDLIHSFKSSCVTFLSEEEVPWTLDGEYGGSTRDVTVKNEQRVLDIMVKNR